MNSIKRTNLYFSADPVTGSCNYPHPRVLEMQSITKGGTIKFGLFFAALFLASLFLASSTFAAVVTVEVTIKIIDPQTRGITVIYETDLGEATIELDVSRNAKITVNAEEGTLTGRRAKVWYDKDLAVVTKIETTGERVGKHAETASSAGINELLNKPVLIENQETKRYLFSDGPPIKGERGGEGGWAASSGFESPKVVGADANYYNRALWKIIPSGNSFLIENQETKRYLFSDGFPIKGERGGEGGWAASSGFESPGVVGSDANYYNRARWKIIPRGDSFVIENQETKRYLFSAGTPIKGERGGEGGWAASSGFESPKVVGADANYYNRALWRITADQSNIKSFTAP